MIKPEVKITSVKTLSECFESGELRKALMDIDAETNKIAKNNTNIIDINDTFLPSVAHLIVDKTKTVPVVYIIRRITFGEYGE